MRDFDAWLSKFRSCIYTYSFYVDFQKVYGNVDSIRAELGLLNTLIGMPDVRTRFKNLIERYPEVLRAIPVLLAKRGTEIYCEDRTGATTYCFDPDMFTEGKAQTIESYMYFMEMTGLFDMIEKHGISNLIDYVTGIEVGLDSNARKNRSGDLMENLVEEYIALAGFRKDVNYFKEMYIHQITDKWGLDLSAISNDGTTEKRFDFVVKTADMVYGIECNFYAGGGSKLNETARSYKTLALESKDIPGFKFVWFTDGVGWNSARNNLRETFEVLDNLYCIDDLAHGICSEIFK